MESAIIQRIKKFMMKNDFSVNSLAKAIDMPQPTLNDYVLGKRKCAFALVDSLLSTYPELSAEWLLRGEGSMFRMPTIIEGGVANGDGATNQYNSKDTIGMFIAEIAEQRKMTQSVIQQNATLLSLLSKKQ